MPFLVFWLLNLRIATPYTLAEARVELADDV
ncbi:hypothetical protein SAMN04489800_0135 [Pseudomonas deceptionensis]|uniref:Uncharacterized protein n=1 Tax=Pseudomonas deceptionensis TaxID=882211 RepID=A0A1H5GQC8_PSEDM|nr:hypothetical protein SAMN04489800_0135 [Pseudomonas deceptionensis]